MGMVPSAKPPVLRVGRTASAMEVEDARPLLSAQGKGAPFFAAAAAPSKAGMAACAALALIYFTVYAISLQGGSHSRDLPFINAHLNTIGRCLITAIAAWTAFMWAARLLGAAAWPARAALATVHICFLLYDHGQDFQFHGFYNWVLFLLIGLPLNLVLLGLFFWYCSMRPRSFAASLFGSAALSVLVVTLALTHYKHIAHRGFFGRSLLPGCSGRHCPQGSEPNCNFPSTTPWVDLLPAGAQNFWTGSQHCPRIRGFEATFDSNGLLTISRCPKGSRQEFTPFPDTRLWSIEQKTHERAAYQTNVMRQLKAENYTRPVVLDGVEAVLARCGDSERLLTRVQPISKREAPEVHIAPPRPAVDTDNDAGSGAASADADGASSGQPERLNVLVMFIDSLGRRHFFRRMPRSAAALQALAERGAGGKAAHKHGSGGRHGSGKHSSKQGKAAGGISALYQFFRYHVTGFHTDPNTHVMYTGSPYENQRAQPFWESYRRNGYVSGSAYNLCEDWGAAYDGMRTPHDHELVAPFCLPEYHPVTPDGEPYQMFKGAFSILRRCLRGQHVHEYNFQYTKQFMAAYDGKAPWLFINSFHEGHEGTGEVLATMDADLAQFMLDLTPEQLNRTAIVFIADHGLTMGLNYMYTQDGRVNHKNPLLAMLLPRWLEDKYPEAAAALRKNEQRLVTGYDFHTTMHHLLHLGESRAPPAEQYPQWQAAGNVTESVRWGVSLLAEVPTGRSCDDAGVPPEFCQCRL